MTFGGFAINPIDIVTPLPASGKWSGSRHRLGAVIIQIPKPKATKVLTPNAFGFDKA